jgi:TNF receptor-associated factor 4
MSEVNKLEQVRNDTVSQDQMDEGDQVRCYNSALGCEWTGGQANLEKHLKSGDGCLWADVECPNRCISGYDDNGKEAFVTVKRKCLKEHLEKECLRRVYECECGMKDEYSKIVNEHQLRDCCEWYVPCENGCNSKIKRKEIDAHQQVCTELIIECPYARIGCDRGEMRQCELIAHLHSHKEQHDLCSRRNDEQKQELKAQRDQSKIEVHQLKAQLRLSEQKVSKLESLKAENESKLRAISTDINIVKSNPCNLRRELALNSIQTQLKTTVDLSNGGKQLVLRMPDYSGYQRRGKVWHSQRFNVCCQSVPYEMFISVFPRGIHSGAGTHISLKLHCVCSEHHELIP